MLVADLLVERSSAVVLRRLTDPASPDRHARQQRRLRTADGFERNDIDDEVTPLRLLVEVPMRLTHAALAPMLAAGQRPVVNIASVAGFIPFSTYGACKAWLVSFSAWANRRYSGAA